MSRRMAMTIVVFSVLLLLCLPLLSYHFPIVYEGRRHLVYVGGLPSVYHVKPGIHFRSLPNEISITFRVGARAYMVSAGRVW